MDVNTILAAAIPSLLVGLVMYKINKDAKEDKDAADKAEKAQLQKDQQIHESFQSIASEIRDERSKRENLEREVHALELQLATTLKREELAEIYKHIEDMRRESKEDLGRLNTAMSEMSTKVITALAAR